MKLINLFKKLRLNALFKLNNKIKKYLNKMRGRGRKYNNKYNNYNKHDNKYYDQNKSKSNIHLSKFLTLILRHKAKDFGLDIEPSGFVKLDDIISLPQSKKYNMTLPLIQEIVSNDEKGRFELVNRPPYYIRAVQGHSMSVVHNEDTMYKLNKKNIFDFPTVVHGTQEDAWELIKKSGLSKMKRNAIHFSIGYNDENHVKSGMRLNCQVFIEILPQFAFFNGYEFFISENKVILCPGNEQGFLPLEFFKKVKNKKDLCLYSCQYEILIKYKFIDGKNNFEIFREDKNIMQSNDPNEIGQFLVDKEYIKEKVIVLVDEKYEENYIKNIKEEVENGKNNYAALFVDYLIDNDSDVYTSEFVKKVDINWNEFYNKKDYKNEYQKEKEEDKKEDGWEVEESKPPAPGIGEDDN